MRSIARSLGVSSSRGLSSLRDQLALAAVCRLCTGVGFTGVCFGEVIDGSTTVFLGESGIRWFNMSCSAGARVEELGKLALHPTPATALLHASCKRPPFSSQRGRVLFITWGVFNGSVLKSCAAEHQQPQQKGAVSR